MGPDITTNGSDSYDDLHKVAFATTARRTNAAGALVHRRFKTPIIKDQLRRDRFHRAAFWWCGNGYFRGG